MYYSRILTILFVALISFSTQAFESAVKPHAMLYLSIPLDGTGSKQDKLTYGFRLDNIEYTAGEPVNYQQQLQRTAVMDIRMDKHGLDGVYVSGKDYVELYHVMKQNEEAAAGETAAKDAAATTDETAASTDATADAEATTEEADDGLTVGDRIKGVFADMRAVAPMGIYMGAVLGVVLLLGVDN